jgi:capsular exopolysaccharide synthesis family protein
MDNSSNSIKNREEESYILEFIKTVTPYKWSILVISILSIFLAKLFLYFQSPVYESYAVVKIKPETQAGQRLNGPDPLGSALAIGGRGVDQELAILQTFYTNNKAIDKLNMKTQYFKKDRYRVIEIFKNPPIEIKDTKIINRDALGALIIIYPVKHGFQIQLNKDKSNKVYHYGEVVKSKLFEFTVEKMSNFSYPIYLKLNGDNRNIYETIVKNSLKVSKVSDKVSLIKVAYQDTSANRATRYVNALIDVYIAQSIVDKSKKNNKILDFIENQLEITGKRLELSERELEDYRIQNSVIEPTVQSTALLNRLSNVEIELSENKIERKLIQNLMQFIKHNKDFDSITPTLRELKDEQTIKIIEKLQDLQREANRLSSEFTEKHPQLKSVREEIKNSKKSILNNIKNLQQSIFQKHNSLIGIKNRQEETLKSLPKKEKHLINLKRNYQVNEKMYSYLLEKKSENEMKKVATISDYEIMDRAYSDSLPIKPKKKIVLILGFLIGLALGVFIAFIRSLFVDKVQNVKDIEQLSTFSIYGELQIALDTTVEVFSSPKSKLSHSFRNLRTNLQFILKSNKSSVVVVTSNIPQEGKTVITTNLSILFQMANHKSIVIDLNLYNPKLNRYFNVEHNKGISTYLSKEDAIGDIIFSTAYPNLDIITAGDSTLNPSDLILSNRLEPLLNTLKKRYDYIFIDTAPFSTVSDTLYVMQHADLNLIVIREGFTKKSLLSKVDGIIQYHNFKNIGLIFNSS